MNKIARLRKVMGLSKREFAHIFYVYPNQVTLWEAGVTVYGPFSNAKLGKLISKYHIKDIPCQSS